MPEAPKPQVLARPIFMVLVVIGCAVILAAYWRPSLSGGGPSKFLKIVNNLKQIEIAKQIWADDHPATNGTEVPDEIVASQFAHRTKQGDLVPSVIGERYTVNGVGIPPEAQLNRSLGKWPKGTIIRLHATTNRPYELLLPKESALPNSGGPMRPP